MIGEIHGLAIFAGGLSLVRAAGYRWYVGEPLPIGLGLLGGVGVVAIGFNTIATIGLAIGETRHPLDRPAVLTYVVTSAAAGSDSGSEKTVEASE